MIDKIASWKYAEDYVLEPEHIQAARRSSEELGVEAITPATGNQLSLLARLAKAKSIVEVGTGAGVSALWLLSAAEDSVLTTIDDEPEYQNVARNNFKNSGIAASRIRVITGKGAAVMANMAESAYDLIFLDADPAELEPMLQAAVGLAKPGAAIVVSHALWRDRVPNPALRDDESSALRQAIRNFGAGDGFVATISLVGDGLLIVAKTD